MSMDDDLFNVPENDEEIDGNDEDEELDDQDSNFRNDNDNDNDNANDGEGEDDDEEDDDDDGEGDDDEDGDGDNDDDDDDEGEDDEGEGDASKDDDEDETKFMDAKESQSQSPSAEPKNGTLANNSDKLPSNDAMDVDEPSQTRISLRESMIQKAKIAEEFDVVPTCAIPYASECHVMAFTAGPKWILTGGEDGFIRKYDFISSIQGKSPLTMAQRHNLVDSVENSGVINSYFENEQPLTRNQLMAQNPKVKPSDFTTGSISYEPKVSPVYALDVEKNGYWCISGTLSGGLSLYSMRYSEGQLQHYFRHGVKDGKPETLRGHNNAISSIKLNFDQDKFLSGSWDKTIRNWDLNTGECIQLFSGSTGQISNVAFRPWGLTDIDIDFDDGDADDNSDMGSLFGDSDEEDENGEKKPKDKEKQKEKEKITRKSKESKTTKTYTNESVFMSSSIDGLINIWDIRTGNQPVIKYGLPEGTPPWCVSSTWSNCGDFIYVGRRNSTVDEFSLKMPHRRGIKSLYTPNVSKHLQFPKISGPVTAVCTMPNNNFLLCGSHDNIRLYDLSLYNPEKPSHSISSTNKNKPVTPFLIIPGHQGGVLSSLYVDDTGRFMVSASGNRGWGQANYTDTVLIYEIDFEG